MVAPGGCAQALRARLLRARADPRDRLVPRALDLDPGARGGGFRTRRAATGGSSRWSSTRRRRPSRADTSSVWDSPGTSTFVQGDAVCLVRAGGRGGRALRLRLHRSRPRLCVGAAGLSRAAEPHPARRLLPLPRLARRAELQPEEAGYGVFGATRDGLDPEEFVVLRSLRCSGALRRARRGLSGESGRMKRGSSFGCGGVTMPWWAWLLVGFLLVVAEMLTPGRFLSPLLRPRRHRRRPPRARRHRAAGLGAVAAVLRPLDRRDADLPQAAARAPAEADAAAAGRRAPRRDRDAGRGDPPRGRSARPSCAARAGTPATPRPRPLAAGERCRVVGMDGLQLLLEPENR